MPGKQSPTLDRICLFLLFSLVDLPLHLDPFCLAQEEKALCMVGCSKIMMAYPKRQASHRSASMKSMAVGMILATQPLHRIWERDRDRMDTKPLRERLISVEGIH